MTTLALTASAQSITGYTFAASSGTFTPLTGGTASGVTSTDDAASGILPIGFTFVYNGVAYTTFSVSTNGFIGLGSQVASSAFNNLSTGTPRPIIAPLWDDNDVVATTNLTYLTSGTAGSRVLTVEWLNTKWNYQATAAVVSFQAKLYEADGHIDFVYRPEAGTINNASASIGLSAVGTGSGNFLSLSDLVAAPTVSSTTETTTIATVPAAGQTYTFTPGGGTVAAPSTPTFSAISSSSGTVTFTDNSTSEYSFVVTLTPTAGGTTLTNTIASTTTAGTGTSYSTTFSGLSGATSYNVTVRAVGQGSQSAASTGTFSTLAGATLSGVYYIGTGTSPQPTRTYATITAAAGAYNTATLTGPVTFLLLDASYSAAETFPIVFGSLPTASVTNTTTIRPNTGVTATISGSVATGAVLKLNGADYFIIDGSNNSTTTQNLTITNTSATGTGNAVLWLAAASATDGATFNTVKNTNITGNSNTGFPQFTVFVGGGGTGVTAPTTSTPAANSNNTLSNNVITKGYYGLFVFGVSTTVLDQANTITGNQLGAGTGNGFGQEGIRTVYQQGLTLTSNEVQNLSSGTATANLYAIYLADCKGAVVSRNSVHNITYTGTSTTKVWSINMATGTFNTAANASANRLDNNLVYAINSTATSGTWNTTGINLGGGYGDQIVYNTVYLSGQLSAASGSAGSAAFANGNPSVTTTATNIDVRNNIFSIIGGTGGSATTPLYAHFEQGTTVTGSTLNYNDLYVTTGATGLAVIGRLNSTNYATLAAWQTATSQEANSVSVDPGFAQTTTVPYNLTPGSASLNNVGTPITGVTVDYTGATRSATPDIGAIEFTPAAFDLKPAALVAPTATQTCFSNAEPLTVQIQNNGAATINFANNAATITVVVTPPTGANQTFTTTLNTGTLATGATQNVTLPGTLNMSATGTYSFSVTATIVGDANTANDNITTTRTNAAPTPLPYTETFPTSTLPTGFTATGFNLSTSANNGGTTGSYGLRVNIYSGITTATATTPVLGATVSANNTLTFDARFTNFSTTGPATVLQAGDKLDVQVSVCGGAFTTVYTITSANQNGTGAVSANFFNYSVPLTGVTAGQRLQVRFVATYGGTSGSDFYVDLDNLNVVSLVPIDIAANALVAPAQPNATTGACYGSAEAVTVQIRNAGSATLDFSVNPVTVSATITGPGTPGTLSSVVLSTGTLAPGATQNVTFTGTANLATAGTYTFTVTASTPNDGNTANNTLTSTITVAAPVAGTLSPAATSICNSGTASLTLTGAANGSIQYQRATSATGPFTNITGATSATYTTPVLTTTTYFRAQVTCGTNVVTSNVSTITVNTPLVASSSPTQTICAGSTATITATASAGSSVRFFTTATGGTALTTATAGTYTTPALTASTTYYAEAYTGGTENVGAQAYNSTGQTQQTGGALYFTATAPTTIQSVTVYLAAGQAAGTVTINLLSGSTTGGAVVNGQSTAFAVPANATSGVISYVVPLNYTVPAAGAYTLYLASATQGGLLRDNTGANTTSYPYTSPSGTVSITGASVTGYYYYFYNWVLGGECVGAAARTAIQVNVTQPATAGFSYPTATVCAGTATTLTPTLATGATAGTYSLPTATGLTINSTTGVVTVAATAVAGTYTVTNTVAANGGCGPVTSTATFTITPQTTATFSYAGSPYCTTATAVTPTITGTTGGTFSSTTGLTINATTGVITPGTSTPGTYTVTYTVAGACGSSSTQTVTITAPATAGFSYTGGPFCVSGTTNPTVTLATGATAGTFTSTTGLTIAANGTITLSTSTPGTYTVTNTVAASGGCAAVTSTATVTINAAPTAGFSYATSTVCAGTAATFTPTLATGATAGTYSVSATTGVTINPTTGVVTVTTAATAGTYTVTNTVAASGGCAAVTSTATFTVNPTPATPTITVTGTPATGITLTSSATTGNQFYLNNVLIPGATGQTLLINSGKNNGTYTVVVTNASGCSATSAPVTVTVTATTPATRATSLSVYPNPTRDGLLTLELSGYQETVRLSIVNALGQKVYETTVSGSGLTQKQELNLSEMATGVYTLQARTASGGVEVRRIVRE